MDTGIDIDEDLALTHPRRKKIASWENERRKEQRAAMKDLLRESILVDGTKSSSSKVTPSNGIVVAANPNPPNFFEMVKSCIAEMTQTCVTSNDGARRESINIDVPLYKNNVKDSKLALLDLKKTNKEMEALAWLTINNEKNQYLANEDKKFFFSKAEMKAIIRNFSDITNKQNAVNRQNEEFIRNILDEMEDMVSVVTKLKKENEEFEVLLSEASYELRDADDFVTTTLAKHKKAKDVEKELEDCKDELKSAKGELRKAEEELATASEKHKIEKKNFENELESNREELQETKNRIVFATNELKVLSEENGKEVAELKSKLKGCKEELLDSREELQEINKELNMIEAALSGLHGPDKDRTTCNDHNTKSFIVSKIKKITQTLKDTKEQIPHTRQTLETELYKNELQIAKEELSMIRVALSGFHLPEDCHESILENYDCTPIARKTKLLVKEFEIVMKERDFLKQLPIVSRTKKLLLELEDMKNRRDCMEESFEMELQKNRSAAKVTKIAKDESSMLRKILMDVNVSKEANEAFGDCKHSQMPTLNKAIILIQDYEYVKEENKSFKKCLEIELESFKSEMQNEKKLRIVDISLHVCKSDDAIEAFKNISHSVSISSSLSTAGKLIKAFEEMQFKKDSAKQNMINDMKKCKKEVSRLKLAFEEIEDMLKEKDIELRKSKTEICTVKESRQELEEKINKHCFELKKTKDENTAFKITVKELEDMIKGKDVELKTSNGETSTSKLVMRELEEKIKESNAELSKSKIALQEAEEKLMESKIAIQDFEGKTKEKDIELKGHRNDKNTLKIAVQGFEEKMKKNEVELKSFENEMITSKIALQDLKEKMQEKEVELKRCRNEMLKSKIAVQDLEEQVEEMGIQLKSSKNGISTSKITVQGLGEKMKERDIELSNLKNVMNTAKITLEEVKVKLREKDIELERYKKESRQFQAAKEELNILGAILSDVCLVNCNNIEDQNQQQSFIVKKVKIIKEELHDLKQEKSSLEQIIETKLKKYKNETQNAKAELKMARTVLSCWHDDDRASSEIHRLSQSSIVRKIKVLMRGLEDMQKENNLLQSSLIKCKHKLEVANDDLGRCSMILSNFHSAEACVVVKGNSNSQSCVVDQAKNLINELEKIRRENIFLKESLDRWNRESKEMKRRNHFSKKSQDTFNRESEEMRRENIFLQERLSKWKEELEEMRRSNHFSKEDKEKCKREAEEMNREIIYLKQCLSEWKKGKDNIMSRNGSIENQDKWKIEVEEIEEIKKENIFLKESLNMQIRDFDSAKVFLPAKKYKHGLTKSCIETGSSKHASTDQVNQTMIKYEDAKEIDTMQHQNKFRKGLYIIHDQTNEHKQEYEVFKKKKEHFGKISNNINEGLNDIGHQKKSYKNEYEELEEKKKEFNQNLHALSKNLHDVFLNNNEQSEVYNVLEDDSQSQTTKMTRVSSQSIRQFHERLLVDYLI